MIVNDDINEVHSSDNEQHALQQHISKQQVSSLKTSKKRERNYTDIDLVKKAISKYCSKSQLHII
jgi:hypothetical protein